MKKRKIFGLTVLAFFAGAIAGFALRNSETADYNEDQSSKEYTFDEKNYFTDGYLQKAKTKRAADKKERGITDEAD